MAESATAVRGTERRSRLFCGGPTPRGCARPRFARRSRRGTPAQPRRGQPRCRRGRKPRAAELHGVDHRPRRGPRQAPHAESATCSPSSSARAGRRRTSALRRRPPPASTSSTRFLAGTGSVARTSTSAPSRTATTAARPSSPRRSPGTDARPSGVGPGRSVRQLTGKQLAGVPRRSDENWSHADEAGDPPFRLRYCRALVREPQVAIAHQLPAWLRLWS